MAHHKAPEATVRDISSGTLPITENQLEARAMGHEDAVISGHNCPHFAVQEF